MLHYPLIIFQLTLLRSAELDVELNALKAMVDNVVAFIHQGESSSKAHAPPPDVRKSTDEVLGDHSLQYQAIGESNSRDPKDPIPPSRLGRNGSGLRDDL
jgi:hypothetical protein